MNVKIFDNVTKLHNIMNIDFNHLKKINTSFVYLHDKISSLFYSSFNLGNDLPCKLKTYIRVNELLKAAFCLKHWKWILQSCFMNMISRCISKEGYHDTGKKNPDNFTGINRRCFVAKFKSIIYIFWLKVYKN